jgi:hypothetical protein
LKAEDPGVGVRRHGAWPNIVLDVRPELQRWRELNGVVEFDELIVALYRQPRRAQLKLKAPVNTGFDPAEAYDIELATRKQPAVCRTGLEIIFEFCGILVADRVHAEQREAVTEIGPGFEDLLRRLDVQSMPPRIGLLRMR